MSYLAERVDFIAIFLKLNDYRCPVMYCIISSYATFCSTQSLNVIIKRGPAVLLAVLVLLTPKHGAASLTWLSSHSRNRILLQSQQLVMVNSN